MACCGKRNNDQSKFDQKLSQQKIANGATTKGSKMSSVENGSAQFDDAKRDKNIADHIDTAKIEQYVAPRHDKPDALKAKLKDMLVQCNTLRNLMSTAMEDDKVMDDLVMALHGKTCVPGDVLIQQGEEGKEVYLIEHGKFKVTMTTKVLGEREIREVEEGTLGEVALALNITRTATVTAVAESKVWVLDREVFNMVRMKNELSTKRQYEGFIKQVPIFGKLDQQTVLMLADSFTPETFPAGKDIITQGQTGDKFYVLNKGISEAIISGDAGEKVVRTYEKPGEYFGEIALLVPDAVRSATVRAKEEVLCLSLSKNDFDRILGSDVRGILHEHRAKYPKYADFCATDVTETVVDKEKEEQGTGFGGKKRDSQEISSLRTFKLEEFKFYQTIGKGGFGRVRKAEILAEDHMPVVNKKPVKTVAVKIMRKDRMRKHKDVRHVLDEKAIMSMINHSMVTKLFGTFQDPTRLFFVMEYIEGGDLFSLIRKTSFLPSDQANLVAAELVLVLGHFHDLGIIYRDLKPENVLIDKEGHIKVIDFGFAIKLNAGQRAWTQCGTPCYMAPELVLGKGYQASVDWWALGVLIYEMLIGNSPFDDPDPMTTLKKIIAFDPNSVNVNHDKGAESLIRSLLTKNPVNRLGCHKGDYVEIQRVCWFSRLDWTLLGFKRYKPPMQPNIQPPKVKGKESMESGGQQPVDQSCFASF